MCRPKVESKAAWSVGGGDCQNLWPVTYPLTGMDLVGTNIFCRGSCSRSELFIFVTSQGCRDSELGSVSQENLQQALGIFKWPAATRRMP